MGNLDIYNAVSSVPDNAKKAIKGGRLNGMTDINPMWRIKTMTEQFGPCGVGWYYNTTNKWLETVADDIVAFVDIELFIKVGGEWSKPIHGTGGSKLATKEKSGIYVSDECYKMATTDAISVACKQLGIGADVYWQSGRSKYTNPAGAVTSEKAQYSTAPAKPNNTGLVTKADIAQLTSMCKQKGFTTKQIFTKPLEQLTLEQFNKAMDQLRTLKDK